MSVDSDLVRALRDEAFRCGDIFEWLGTSGWSRRKEGALNAIPTLASTSSRLLRLASTTNQLLNALQSYIFSLPDDVLVLIFRNTAWIDPPENGCRGVTAALGWMALPRVCVRWRDLVEGDQVIWAQAYSQVPSQRELFLRRAGDALTTFEISPQVPRLHSAIIFASPALHRFLLDSDLSNCRAIVLQDCRDLVTYLYHVFNMIGDGRVPVLAELRVGAGHSTEHRLVRFCRKSTGRQRIIVNLPKLKSLVLDNIFFAIVAEGLETLRLRRVHCSAISAVPRLRTVVRSLIRPHAHTLRHLELSRAFKLDNVAETPDSVALPMLRTLRIHGSLLCVLAVLSVLQVPRGVQRDLTVDLGALHAAPSTVQDAWGALAGSFDSSASNAVYICYRESGQRLKDERNVHVLGEALDIELYTENAAFKSRVRGVTHPAVSSLILRLRWALNGEFTWWSLLGLVAQAIARDATVTAVFLDMPKHYWYPQQAMPWVKAAEKVVDAFPDLTNIGPRGKVLAAIEEHLWKEHRIYIRIACLDSI
ncbi:unnamed protein product [Peniophora sp. CBMAI 1063]|nr:unnamed protein product [Peniophora sp. CBMAI 1063]